MRVSCFPPMSDDPCRLTTNLDRTSTRSTNRRQRRSARSLTRASNRSGAGGPVAVHGSRHGTRRAHRSPAQGRGRMRRRPIAGAHRRARWTTRRVRRCRANPCVDESGVVGAAAADVAVATRRASVGRDGGVAARVVRRLRMRWTKTARIDRPVALRAPRYDPFPIHPRSHPPYPVNPGELRFASAIFPVGFFPAEVAPPPRLDPAPRPRSTRAIASITPPRASR